MRTLLNELGFPVNGPSTLHMDNLSAVQVARNPEHHGRMKHLDMRYHWLRDQVDAGVIDIAHLPTARMPADVLTKALGRVKMEEA